MQNLQHNCRNALIGLKANIKAYRRATNEIVAEKEWKAILAAMARIESALNTYHEKGKRS